MKDTKIKLAELAARISAHLRRFQQDLKINAPDECSGLHPYWEAWACQAGNRIGITYVLYQGQTTLTRTQAEAYLAWLDAGNVGKHWAMERHASA